MERDWTRKAVSAEEAVGLIQSGMNVFVHGAAATPTPLLKAMVGRNALEGVRLYHIHTSGETPFVDPGCEGRFFSVSLFTGPALRKPIEEGRADFMPIFLSDIPALFQSGRIRLDVALLQLSPPDAHGLCTLGTSVDTAKAAADSARILIAEINEQMPRTHGNTSISMEKISAFVWTDRPLPEAHPSVIGPVEARIGEIIAALSNGKGTVGAGYDGVVVPYKVMGVFTDGTSGMPDSAQQFLCA